MLKQNRRDVEESHDQLGAAEERLTRRRSESQTYIATAKDCTQKTRPVRTAPTMAMLVFFAVAHTIAPTDPAIIPNTMKGLRP